MSRDPLLRGPKFYTEQGQKYRLSAHGGLHFIRGNSAPHFSLTATQDRKAPNGRWMDDMGGCCHPLILKHWPDLADLAAMHLSDIDGTPMHADGNGWYWFAGALGGLTEEYHGGNVERQHWKPDGSFDGYRKSTPDECLKVFADHVRINMPLAEEFRASYERDLSRGGYSRTAIVEARARFTKWIVAQAPRWKSEADACIAKHGLKVYGDHWTPGA